jgi:hypothetical protein
MFGPRGNVSYLPCGLTAVAYAEPRRIPRSHLQVQVLAALGSLSGISYPDRVQELISVAKLANLDLVRSAAPCNKHEDVESWKRIGGSSFGFTSGSSSNGLHRTFAHQLLHKQHRPLRLANCHRALRCGHSITSWEVAAGYSISDAASRWTRILRTRGSQADECTLLRCTPHAMPGWRRSPCCICSEHG